MRSLFLSIVALIAALNLNGCASLPGREPVQITVAGIDSLPGEGLEVRMMVKLRVQNPNDAPVEYDGVFVKLEVQDSTFATGVSDARGSIPRFGESVIAVPVTISPLRIAFHAIGAVLDDKPIEKVRYRLTGKLNGPGFGSQNFQANGELALPKS